MEYESHEDQLSNSGPKQLNCLFGCPLVQLLLFVFPNKGRTPLANLNDTSFPLTSSLFLIDMYLVLGLYL